MFALSRQTSWFDQRRTLHLGPLHFTAIANRPRYLGTTLSFSCPGIHITARIRR